VYNESGKTYGSPRVYRQLADQGMACTKNRPSDSTLEHATFTLLPIHKPGEGSMAALRPYLAGLKAASVPGH
jgi:hypothetical protein